VKTKVTPREGRSPARGQFWRSSRKRPALKARESREKRMRDATKEEFEGKRGSPSGEKPFSRKFLLEGCQESACLEKNGPTLKKSSPPGPRDVSHRKGNP